MYMCVYVMVEKSQLIVLLTCNSFYHWGGGGGGGGRICRAHGNANIV